MKRHPVPLLVLFSGIAIVMTLVYSLRVQAQQADQRRGQEQRAWSAVRNLPASMEILRPAWLPAVFWHLPVVSSSAWSGGNVGGYSVAYCSADCSGTSPELDLALNPQAGQRAADVHFSVHVRGTAGVFSIYRSSPRYEVTWREGGQRYAVSGSDLLPSALFKVVAGLRRVSGAPASTGAR